MTKLFLTHIVDCDHQQHLLELNTYYHFPVQGWRFDTCTDVYLRLLELKDKYVVVCRLGNFLRHGSIGDEIISDNVLAGTPELFCLNLTKWDRQPLDFTQAAELDPTIQERCIKIPSERFDQIVDAQFADDLRTVYVLNSEDVTTVGQGHIDHYAGVCGGLKAVAILMASGFTPQTRVSLFDISQPALDYQRYLVETWDGDFDTYRATFAKFEQANPELIYAWRSWNSWDDEIDSFLQSARTTKEQFKSAWSRYIQLPITYTQLDLHKQDQVKDFVMGMNTLESKNYYVWASNAFHMEHTIARYGQAWLEANAQKFKELLSKLTGNVRLEQQNQLILVAN